MVGHPVILRGLRLPGLAGGGATPTILSVAEQDFLPWVIARLTPARLAELTPRDALARVGEDGTPRLFQPVHRSFNIVALEVACEVEGQPRLDPGKILGAGVTLRRRVLPAKPALDKRGRPLPVRPAPGRDYGPGLYGWMKKGGRVLGWRPVAANAHARFAPDPLPEFRDGARMGRNARVLRHAPAPAPDEASWAEEFTTLTPAPEAICKALGKTILFGYLPVTSSERSEEDGPPDAPFDRQTVADRLPYLLWSGTRIETTADGPTPPPQGTTIATSGAASPSAALQTLIAGLTYLSQEPGLFLDPAGGDDPAADLRALLSARQVTPHGGDPVDFLSWLRTANAALVERDPAVTTLALPDTWPAWSEEDEARLTDAILTAMAGRWAQLSPGETRFQTLDARYEVQAFVRVDRSDCGCPPLTVWTAPAGPVRIVPWFEGGEAPPTLIELPAPSALKGKIAPNVAFKVPEEIQKFMSGMKLDKLMQGEQPGPRWGFGMICGFSIPIITICAFIVLQIFLALFHILFWWLPFIRICIPFPRKEDG